MSKQVMYYRYDNKYVGEKFFRTNGTNDVLSIVSSVQEKKGRTFCIGVTYIKYSTFIGSWGWKLEESKNIVEIKKSEFNYELKKMVNKFKVK